MAASSLRSVSKKRLAKILIPLLIAAGIIFNILAPLFAIIWSQQPFLGFLLYPRLIVSDSYSPNWDLSTLGLQAGDILVSIDNAPVASGRDVYLTLREHQVNETVSLKIDPVSAQPADAAKTLPISLKSFPGADLLIFFWLPYAIGLVYLALGLTVYHLRGGERVGTVFVAFCVLVSILVGGFLDQHTLHFLSPVWAFAFPVTGASLLHLSLVFPTETRLLRRRPWLSFVSYLPALLLGIINLYSLYLTPNPRLHTAVQMVNSVFLSLSAFLFFSLLLNARLTSLSRRVRQQITVIFWGSVIAFGPGAIWVIARALGFGMPFGWPLFIAVFTPLFIFPMTIAFASLRYRLLDLDLVFSRGITYTLLIVLVTAAYFFTVSLLVALFQNTTLYQNPIIIVVFILVLVLLLEPLKNYLQASINRFFLVDQFDSRQLLQLYGRALTSSPLDTDEILKLLLSHTNEALLPEQAIVFLKDPARNSYTIRHQLGVNGIATVEVQFGEQDDLVKWLTNTHDILQLSSSGATQQEVYIGPEELARLHMLDLALCVPLLGSDYLLGWLALGPKRSASPYTSSDLMFLATLASQTTIALENARFLEQANRRAAELEALQEISVDIQAEVEPDQLLKSVVERAARLLGAEGGMVFLLEPDNQTLKAVVSYNLGKDYTGSTLKTYEGLTSKIMQLGEPVVIDNYQNLLNRPAQFKDANFGAVMGAPFHWQGRVRGILYLVHRSHGPRFSKNDVWLIEFFAIQAAIALEKSQLLQQARDRATQLATLMDVSSAISSTLNLDDALQRVMDRAVQILNAEAGSLLLMDRYGKELIFEVVLGPTGAELRGARIPVGQGIVGTVAKTGEALIVNDVASDPRWEVAFDEATAFQTRDILCVPMITHEQVVGVIEVINKQDRTTFTEEERDLLLSFGAQSAIAIENAQHFTRVDQALAERVQELQALQMFDQELQNLLELNRVLDITLTHAMDALGISLGVIGIIGPKGDPGLYLLAQHGMPMEMGRYKIDPWPLAKGVIGRVARTGELAWVNDITKEKDYVPKNHRTRSLLIVPILREDRVIGVIDLESTDPDYFTSDDVSFVRVLISHAAIAIENAYLFDQVKDANEAKSEFMSTASHELKIPMTSIKGYAKLLHMGAGGSLTDQQKEFLSVITNNVDRMSQLVNDLLDVSRIEAGRIRLEIRDVQMKDVIDEVLASVQTQIENKQLNLTKKLADNLPKLRADYNRMVQIVTNLISNAYKYTPAGGSITVTARPYNGDIRGIAVSVADTGYGMSEEDQTNLFTTFFRSSDENVRNEPGTGLGLAITKKMVESHGGELSFESELGQGSTFTFTMPLVCKIPPGVEVSER
jgi:signal transduction histidine kinase